MHVRGHGNDGGSRNVGERNRHPSYASPHWPDSHCELSYLTAGTRAQAPPAMVAERHGRRGSQATWSPALPLPAAVPAGYGPCAESPASDLPGRLAAGDCLTGVQPLSPGGSTRRQGHLGRCARLRLRCGNGRAAAGGCHRASLMIKRSDAAAAVRPGPAAPSRLTALVVSAVHVPGPVGRAGAAASLRLRNAGPDGPFRVSLDW